MNKRTSLGFIHYSVDDLDLPGNTLKVYLRLVRRAGRRGTTYQSAKTLADQMTIGEGTIKKALRELIEVGLIARTINPDSKGGSSTEYRILPAEEWVGFEGPDGSKSDPPETIPTGQNLTDDGAKSDPSHIRESKTHLVKPNEGAKPRKKKVDEFVPVDPIPSEWTSNPDFTEAWDAYVEARWNRWKGKVAWTPRAAKIASGKLFRGRNLSDAIDHLNDASVAGWQNLIAVNGSSQPSAPKFESTPSNDQALSDLKL